MLDWSLRDKSSGVQPMPGGLPDWADSLAFLTPVALAVAVLIAMPKHWGLWIRLLLAVLHFAVAFAGLVVGRIYYVVSSGIDTI